MPRIYPTRSFGVVSEANAFKSTLGITNDSSKTLATNWTDQKAGRVASGPSSSSYPTFNLIGPGLKQGWRWDGIGNVMNLDSGFLGQFTNLTGITFQVKMRPGSYPSGSAETYAFFMSDGGTSNGSVGRFAIGFIGNTAANQLVVTGRRVDGGSRFVDYIGTSGNAGSFWANNEEFVLTVTVDYTGSSFGDGSKCVWSVWKDDRLVYRQNTSSFNAGSINTTTAPLNKGASSTPYAASLGGSVINNKYGKFINGDWSMWPSCISDSEIISKAQSLKQEMQQGNIQITTPSHSQAYQKNGSNQQDIVVSGLYFAGSGALMASFNGGTAQQIVANVSGGTFSGTLTAQNAGQGDLRVWFANDPTNYCIRRKVAITDVYVLYGQSNNTDRTDTAFSIAGPKTYTMPANMGPCIFNSRYLFAQWSDASLCQNFPVQLAQAYYNKNGYPCAFVYAAIGGTNIDKWQPNSTDVYTAAASDGDQFGLGVNLYNRMKLMITAAIGSQLPRAFIRHQGEANAGTDAQGNQLVSQAGFLTSIQNIADGLNTDYPGVPTLETVLQIIRSTSNVVITATNVRNAQIQAPSTRSNIVAGANLSDLECDYQSTIGYFHLLNDTVVTLVATRQFNALVAAGLA